MSLGINVVAKKCHKAEQRATDTNMEGPHPEDHPAQPYPAVYVSGIGRFRDLLFALVFFQGVCNAQLPIRTADWQSLNAGVIGDVSFTINPGSYTANPITARSLIGTDFSAAPRISAQLVIYRTDSNWTVTFSEEVKDVYLYATSWRGGYFTSSEPAVTYTFSRPFQILSGMTRATQQNTSLTCPDFPGQDTFHSGILKFAGPLRTIGVTSNCTHAGNNSMTFGLYPRATLLEGDPDSTKTVNIVFFPDGYQQHQLSTFASEVQSSVNYLFSREPWNRYRSYFAIYRVDVPSYNGGTDNGTIPGLQDTYFNTGFTDSVRPELLTMDAAGGARLESMKKDLVPNCHIPILLVNDVKYGGAGGPVSIASRHSTSTRILEHEIGHSFAQLADEYDNAATHLPSPNSPNVASSGLWEAVPWSYWLDPLNIVRTEPPADINAVGIFQGALGDPTFWYRPHYQSIMSVMGAAVGQINREALTKEIYNRVRPILSFYPTYQTFNVDGEQPITVFLNPRTPSTAPGLKFYWWINAVEQTSFRDQITFTVNSKTLGNGSTWIRGRAFDPTSFVKIPGGDPNAVMYQDIVWLAQCTNQPGLSLQEWRTNYGADNANPSGDGIVNLAKYALGIPPTRSATATELPAVTSANVSGSIYGAFDVRRSSKNTDLTYTVEVSDDLTQWHSGAGYTVTLEDTEGRLLVRSATARASLRKSFFRLKVATQ